MLCPQAIPPSLLRKPWKCHKNTFVSGTQAIFLHLSFYFLSFILNLGQLHNIGLDQYLDGEEAR